MGIGRKGFFFTFLAMIILSIFIVVFGWEPEQVTTTTFYSDKGAIEIASSFTKDLTDAYIPRVLVTSMTNAVDAMNAEAMAGNPITDFDLAAKELMMNGTLNGVPSAFMINQTFKNWTDKIVVLGRDNLRIISNVTLRNLKFEQSDPWYITVSAELNILTNYSSIMYRIGGIIQKNISIEGFKDPIFAQQALDRVIHQSSTILYTFPDIVDQIHYGTFKHSSLAPSFMMRMENNTGFSDCCGIMSLINSSDVANFPIRDYSYIDYLYFNKIDYCPYKLFNMTPVWDDPYGVNFKIDNDYLFSDYGFWDDGVNVTLIC